MRRLAIAIACSAWLVVLAGPRASAQPEPDWEQPWAGQGGPDGQRPRPRGGFFLRASGTLGPALLFSDANPLSGFRQRLATDTSGLAYGLEGELGIGITRGWLLGVYLGYAFVSELRVHVRDRVATLDPGGLAGLSLGGAVTYEPWADGGYHVSLRVGYGGLRVTTDEPFDDRVGFDIESRQLRGPQLVLIAGKEWRIYRGLWAGPSLRLLYAHLAAGPGTDSTSIAPSLAVTVSWF